MIVLVEGEEVRVEVSRPAQLQERDPATGLDDEDRDAAVMNSHPQPGPGVQLESAAHEISDNIPVTDQHVHAGVLLTGLCSAEVLPEGGLYPGPLLGELVRLPLPLWERRLWRTGRSFSDQ